MKGIIDILASGLRDRNGSLLSEGTVTVYDAGTTALRTIYSDFELETELSNPFTLDDRGSQVAYTDKRVKLLVKDSLGRFVQVIDDVGIADSDINATITGLSDVPGAGIALDSSTNKLSVDIDGTTITNSGGVLSVALQGIGTAQLAAGAVTYAKLSEHNIGSGEGVSFYPVTGLYTAMELIDELSVEITTNGRPVIILLTSNSATNAGSLLYIADGASSFFAFPYVSIYRDSTLISENVFASASSTTAGSLRYMPSMIKEFDSPAAGTYTYSVKCGKRGSANTFTLSYLNLTVYEI